MITPLQAQTYLFENASGDKLRELAMYIDQYIQIRAHPSFTIDQLVTIHAALITSAQELDEAQKG